MDKVTHLIKLSVGSDSVETLQAWQDMRCAELPDGLPRHITRMWPKRETEVVNGGSIYWVIKGFVQCRQRVLRFDEVFGEDGIRRCAIVLDPNLCAPPLLRGDPSKDGAICPQKMHRPILGPTGKQKIPCPQSLQARLQISV